MSSNKRTQRTTIHAIAPHQLSRHKMQYENTAKSTGFTAHTNKTVATQFHFTGAADEAFALRLLPHRTTGTESKLIESHSRLTVPVRNFPFQYRTTHSGGT